MGSIIWGIIILALGVFIMIKTDAILRLNGRIMWAEIHFGSSGGSRLLYKLIGFLLIFIAFLLITGMAGNFFLWMLGPVIRMGG